MRMTLMSTLQDRFLAPLTPIAHEQWKLWLSIIAVAGVYSLIAFTFMPPGVFWSPDSGMKYIQMQNIRWEDGLELSINYPGRDLDPEFQMVPLLRGYYKANSEGLQPVWLPYFPLAARVAHDVFGPVGHLVLPIIAGMIAVCGTYSLARLLGLLRAGLVVLFVAFLTPLAIYSVLFWEHTTYTAVVTLAVVALLWARRQQQMQGFLVGGILLGLGPFFRPEGYIFAAATLSASVLFPEARRDWRGVGVAMTGWLSVTALLFGLNWSMYGSLLSLHEARSPGGFTGLAYLEKEGLNVVGHFLVGVNVRPTITVIFLASGSAFVTSLFLSKGFWQQVAVLAGASGYLGAAALIQQESGSLDRLHGLLAASPMMILALAPAGTERDAGNGDRWIRAVAIAYAALGGAGLSLMGPDVGGREWGPRFFLPVYILLAPLALRGLRQAYHDTTRTVRPAAAFLGTCLLLVSLSVQAQGLERIRKETMHNQEIRDILIAEPETVVTDLWWLAGATASMFYAKRIFLAEHELALSSWLGRASEAGVRGFWFVSFLPREGSPLFMRERSWPFRLEVQEIRRSSAGLLFMRMAIEP